MLGIYHPTINKEKGAEKKNWREMNLTTNSKDKYDLEIKMVTKNHKWMRFFKHIVIVNIKHPNTKHNQLLPTSKFAFHLMSCIVFVCDTVFVLYTYVLRTQNTRIVM